MASVLEQLQSDVAARLESLSYFSDVPVFVLREETVQSKIDAALAGLTQKEGKTGAAVSVLMPLLDVPKPNVPGPQCDITITVRCQEIPVVNFGSSGTGKSCEEIALEVLRSLHHFRLEGVVETLYADKDAVTPSREFLPKLTYDVRLRSALLQLQGGRCELPAVAEEGLEVSFSGGTEGSSIYYTTDQTYPSAKNSNAVLYTVPFTVVSGTVVRWAAYKTGLEGSDVGRVTIT